MHENALDSPVIPWYREPWPWFLMAGPAVAVVAGFATLYIALQSANPLVVDNYYKEGLAINRVLARDHLARQGGYAALGLPNGDRTMLRVMLSGSTLPAELRVRFVHPTLAGHDREIVAQRIQPGMYEARVSLPSAARWDVEVEGVGQPWRLTGSWYPADGQFRLAPRS
jgi:uncharacterized protein